MAEKVPITIIGGGVIGCAIAYELSKQTDKGIFLIEKNARIAGENQSSRNSGVIHAGIYYQRDKEPLKARFCVEGNRLMYQFCEEFDVPHTKTGKLIVATSPMEEEYLEDVLSTSADNNVEGITRISADEAKAMEPNVFCKSALYIPTSGIVEPTSLVKTLYRLAESKGACFVTGNKIADIRPKAKSFEITAISGSAEENFETEMVINCAGLYSDEIARMINPDSPYEINPVRGELAKFYRTKKGNVFMNGMNVYPTPYGFYTDSGEKAEVSLDEFHGLLKEGRVMKTVGAHLTPTFDLIEGEYAVGSTVTIGPLFTTGVGKEDYSSCLHPEQDYLKKVKDYFPNLPIEDIMLHYTGIQARLKGHRDFVIERDKRFQNFINLIGIDSPGLTSCLAIAKYIAEIIKQV